ncbi:MAG TPA: alpha-amylase [Bacteroidales bacterium]|nr:alpha-amylase [Bacteroidales bacterium]
MNSSTTDFFKDKTLYELNIRQFTPEGTIKSAIKHMAEFNELGIGAIWVMPIQPIGKLKRKGSLGSPYSISDYCAINPEFGTFDDFKKFVEVAHSYNIKVLLDWVANHTAWDHDWITKNTEYYTLDAQGNPVSPFPEWEDVADLNYSNRRVWEQMLQSMRFWVENFGIDGFRCDMAHLVPDEFWQFAISKLNESKDLFWLAESERRELINCGFNSLYNWNLFHIFSGIAGGRNNVYDIDNVLGNTVFAFPKNANQLWFTSNHDENSWHDSEFARFGSSLQAFTVINFLLPGIPLLYSGQEFSSHKKLAFFDKDLIERKSFDMFHFYQKLIQFKKENQLLWSNPQGGEFKRIFTDNGESVFVFMRQNGDKKMLFLANLSNKHSDFTLQGYDFCGEYQDFFIGGNYTFYPKHYFNFAPFEFKLYYTKY